MAFWIIIHIDLFEHSKLLQALSLLELEILDPLEEIKGKDDRSIDLIHLINPACHKKLANCFAN